jgi:hypothetical protein
MRDEYSDLEWLAGYIAHWPYEEITTPRWFISGALTPLYHPHIKGPCGLLAARAREGLGNADHQLPRLDGCAALNTLWIAVG